jgi:Spy/CpxP family protein refolding chaperone
MSSPIKGKVLVFATFFLGMITGALVVNVYETRIVADAPGEGSGRRAQQDVERFFDYLNLTPEQRQQWNDITQENRPEFDRIYEENRKLTAPNRARWDALQEQTRERIRSILTEEQRQRYNEFTERQRQRRQPQTRRD